MKGKVQTGKIVCLERGEGRQTMMVYPLLVVYLIEVLNYNGLEVSNID